ncbi:MAG: hypothetical protein V1729_01275 [Candidatus Woesearchaeota archaeon]
MRHTSSFNILAVILIFLGTVFMLDNYGIIQGILIFWPLLPMMMGTGFCMLFFRARKRDVILLGIGCFILLNSAFFFYLNFTSWFFIAYLWPVFIMILGMTFFACYLFSGKKIILYLSVILTAIGISFILIFALSTRLWPITLVFTGISFIIINTFPRHVKQRCTNAKKR